MNNDGNDHDAQQETQAQRVRNTKVRVVKDDKQAGLTGGDMVDITEEITAPADNQVSATELRRRNAIREQEKKAHSDILRNNSNDGPSAQYNLAPEATDEDLARQKQQIHAGVIKGTNDELAAQAAARQANESWFSRAKDGCKSASAWMTSRVYLDKTGAIIPEDKIKHENDNMGDSDFDEPSDVGAKGDNNEGNSVAIEMVAVANASSTGGENKEEPPTASHLVLVDAEDEKILPVGSCSKGCYYPATYLAAGAVQAWGYLGLIVFACRALPVTATMKGMGVFAFWMSVLVNAALPGLSAVSSFYRIYAHILAARNAIQKRDKFGITRHITTLVLGTAAAVLTSLPFVVLDFMLQKGSEDFLADLSNNSSPFWTLANQSNATGTSWPETFYLMDNQLANYSSITDGNADIAGLCYDAHTTLPDTSWMIRATGMISMFTLMLIADAMGLVDSGFEFSSKLKKNEGDIKKCGYRSTKAATTVVYAGSIALLAAAPQSFSSDLTSLTAYLQGVFIPVAIAMTLLDRVNEFKTPAEKKVVNPNDPFVTFIANNALALLLLSIAPLPSIAMGFFKDTPALEYLLVASVFVFVKFSTELGGPFARDMIAITNMLSKSGKLSFKWIAPEIKLTAKDKSDFFLAAAELRSKLIHAIVYLINYVTLYAGFENINLTVPEALRPLFYCGIFVSSYAFNNGRILELAEKHLTDGWFCSLANKFINDNRVEWKDLNKEQQGKMRTWAESQHKKREKSGENPIKYGYILPAGKTKNDSTETNIETEQSKNCLRLFAMARQKTEANETACIAVQSVASLVGDGTQTVFIMAGVSFLIRTALDIASTNNPDELPILSAIINALLTLVVTRAIKDQIHWFGFNNPYKRPQLTDGKTIDGLSAEGVELGTGRKVSDGSDDVAVAQAVSGPADQKLSDSAFLVSAAEKQRQVAQLKHWEGKQQTRKEPKEADKPSRTAAAAAIAAATGDDASNVNLAQNTDGSYTL